MTSRKLGGGRILGSGKGLAPPSPSPAIKRAASPHSPSSSTLSFGGGSIGDSLQSPASGSPSSVGPLPPGFAQDLASNISIGGPSNGAASGSGTKLVCPICEEEMVCACTLRGRLQGNCVAEERMSENTCC